MPAECACVQVGPVRVLSLWLPGLPAWNKHGRVKQTREGRRFLVPEARLTRAEIVAAVRPVLPARPWFDANADWFVSYVQFLDGAGFDDDQWLGGLRDDLIETGLVADDNRARTSRLVTRTKGPAGIFIIASQETA